jgi:uncharacterized membrane protein (DUF106 family)
MSLSERIEQATSHFTAWAIAAVGGFIVWLVRRVFTNQQEIELLKQNLQQRDRLREEDREALLEVKEDVKEMRKDQQQIMNVLMERNK